jgi:hypothetical protein
VREAVQTAYPRSRPDFADKFAVHCARSSTASRSSKASSDASGSNPA